jgi:hypothetical protein
MKFHTKRYDIEKVSEADGFNEGIKYAVYLNDGYYFESDGTRYNSADSYEELLELIAEIREGITEYYL